MLLIPLPDSGSVETEFTVRWDRLPWKLPRPTRIEALSEDNRVLHTEAPGEELRVRAAQNIFAYRFVAGE
jgi:hypothetical protein